MSAIYQLGANGLEQLVPKEPNTKDFLVGSPMETNPTWTDYLEALDFVTESISGSTTKKIQTIRAMTPQTDVSTVRATCQLLGFDLDADIYQLSANSILKVVTQLSTFTEFAAGPDFIKFFDFIVNAQSVVTYLWTKDYRVFYPQPQGLTIIDGGEWYQTTHVNLEVELNATQDIIDAVFNQGTNRTIAQKLKEIFYEFAPITLVLDSVILAHTSWVTMGFGAQLLPYRRDEIVIQSAPWLGGAILAGKPGSIYIDGSAIDTSMILMVAHEVATPGSIVAWGGGAGILMTPVVAVEIATGGVLASGSATDLS